MAQSQHSQRSTIVRFRNRRWTVGTMVAVSITVAVLLTVVLQLWAFQAPVRLDLTSRGLNSLDDGTRSVLRGLDDEVHVISLYYKSTDFEQPAQARYRQAVDDLLRLYAQENPTLVDTSWINPLQDQQRFGEVLDTLRRLPAFAGESEPYVAAVSHYEQDVHPQLKQQLDGSIAELQRLSQTTDGGQSETTDIVTALRTWTQLLDELHHRLLPLAQEPLPDYTVAVENIRRLYSQLAEKFELFLSVYVDQQMQADLLSNEVKLELARMKDALLPWPAAFRAEVEALQILPPLRLRQLEQALRQSNVIIVHDDELAKVVTFEDMWPPARPGTMPDIYDFDSRRFAGSGTLTPAIFQLVEDRRSAVVFVRYGGPGLFKPFDPMKPSELQGPMLSLKRDLEKLNFVVTEWNLARTQERPVFDPPPARIIYVVLRPGPSRGGGALQSGDAIGSAERAALLSAIHDSGRAIFLTGWDLFSANYQFAGYLETRWGIDINGSTLLISALPVAPGEWTLNQQSFSFLFNQMEYAEHPATTGLAAVRPTVLPQATTLRLLDSPPDGVTHEVLARIPANPDIWAVRDVKAFLEKFNATRNTAGSNVTAPTAADLRPPFPAIVLAHSGEDRVMVVAAGGPWIGDSLTAPQIINSRLMRQAPGNWALFVNLLHELNDSLEWANLASPLDDSKLVIDQRHLAWWRAAVVAVLPGLALLCGLIAWFVRRR